MNSDEFSRHSLFGAMADALTCFDTAARCAFETIRLTILWQCRGMKRPELDAFFVIRALGLTAYSQ
jgi:hypothetical protein